jgi:hypothetical protein
VHDDAMAARAVSTGIERAQFDASTSHTHAFIHNKGREQFDAELTHRPRKALSLLQ